MISLLFDIDGTLIRAGGAGMRAVHEVLTEMFGDVPRSELKVHGRTDHGIMTEVFEAIGRDYQSYRADFDQRYWRHLPSVMQATTGVLLPGVSELLELLVQQQDIALGLLTGNAREAANVKLQHFGIEHYFSFGGYGDDHSDRNDVAALAVAQARSQLDGQFKPDQVWVIGDTVRDIQCARSVGAKVVAVETGGGSASELKSASPDLLLEDLRDAENFLLSVRNF